MERRISGVKVLSGYFILVTLEDGLRVIFDAGIGLRTDTKGDDYSSLQDYQHFKNDIDYKPGFVVWDDRTCYNLPWILEHCEFVKPKQIVRCCELELFIYSESEILCVHRGCEKYEEALINIYTKQVAGDIGIRCMNRIFSFIDENKNDIVAMANGEKPIDFMEFHAC